MGPHDTETSYVTMLYAIGRLLFHLCEDIADDLGWLVGVLGWVAQVHGHVRELWPRERVVEIVLEEVVLGEVRDIGLLHVRNVRGAEESDIHLSLSCLPGSVSGVVEGRCVAVGRVAGRRRDGSCR